MNTDTCAHPAERLFTWIVEEEDEKGKVIPLLCWGCCDCGKSGTRKLKSR